MFCICARVASTIWSGHPSARAAAAIFSMTCSPFFSLMVTASMRQADMASKAAFTALRASSESSGVGLKWRGLASANVFSMTASPLADLKDLLRRQISTTALLSHDEREAVARPLLPATLLPPPLARDPSTRARRRARRCTGLPGPAPRSLAGDDIATAAVRRLFERGLDAGESRVQLGADALQHGDDCNRDAGRNKTIFDGGRTGLVTKETCNKLVHVSCSLRFAPLLFAPLAHLECRRKLRRSAKIVRRPGAVPLRGSPFQGESCTCR